MDMYLYTTIGAALCRQLEENASLDTAALLSHYSPMPENIKWCQKFSTCQMEPAVSPGHSIEKHFDR